MEHGRKAAYERQLNEEIERRIEAMEHPDYPFPKRFGRRDAVVWAVVVIACLALVLLGAKL